MPVDPIVLRAIERILAFVIGGLAIYFGYRLFLAVPDQQGEEPAELTLAKDKRLLTTCMGPGAFFAPRCSASLPPTWPRLPPISTTRRICGELT